MSKYVYGEGHERFDIEDALTISRGEWSDGNPSNVNRLGLFVTAGNELNKVTVASANDYVCGVTIQNNVFLGGDAEDPRYCVVQSLGICVVRFTGSLEVGDKCMPGSQGRAVRSSNDLGYRVVEIVDSSHARIIMSPNNDMIKRIKDDMTLKQNNVLKGTAEPSSSVGANGDVYFQLEG